MELLCALPIAKRMLEAMDAKPRTSDSVRGFRGLAMQLIEILASPGVGSVIPPNHLGVFREGLHQLKGIVDSGTWPEDTIAGYVRDRVLPALEAMQAIGATPPDPLFKNVVDAQLREILSRDLEEAEECLNRGLNKSCVVLCGSILEAALYDLLRRNLTWVQDPVRTFVPRKKIGSPKNIMSSDEEEGWKLADLIAFAANNGSILDKKDVDHLGKILREPRNLVHPMAELRRDSIVSADQAAASYYSLRIALERLARITTL